MILKRMAGVVMAAMLLTTFLTGCSTNGTEQSDGSNGTDQGNKTEAAAMGRYLEEDIELPEGIDHIQALCEMEDGSLRLAGLGEEGGGGVWDTGDQGKTWNKVFDYPKELKVSDTKYVSSVALSPKGGAAAIMMDYSNINQQSGQGQVQTEYWTLDDTGKAVQLPVQLGGNNTEAKSEPKSDAQSEGGTTDQQGEGGSDIQLSQKEGDGSEAPEVQTEGNDAGNTETNAEGNSDGNAEIKSEGNSEGGQGVSLHDLQYLNTWKYTPDNQLAGIGVDGKIYIIDSASGALIRSIDNSEAYFTNIGFVGNTLAAYASNGVYYYDMATGNSMEKDAVLNEQLVDENRAGGIVVGGGGSDVLLQGGKEDNILYFCNKEGIFRHVLNGNVSEQLVDGSLNSMSDPSVMFSDVAAMKDGTFFLAFTKNNGSNLVRYTYSEDTPSVPEKEVNIYSLKENAEIRQAIALFQKQNPDTRVNYEVGITGDDGVTVSDAIRTLNTNIMAGKGPDLFVLDGMSMKSYEDKGLLEDMSAILKQVADQDGFLENITKSFEKDGKTYAIPTRFMIPGVQSDKKTLDGITDLKTLADTVERMKQENGDKEILGSRQPNDLLDRLYDTSAQNWIKEDGTLKEDALKEFFTLLKRIYEVDKRDVEENNVNSSTMVFGGLGRIGASISDDSMRYLGGNSKLNIGNINSINDLMQVLAVDAKIKDSTYKPLDGQASKIFVPSTMIGISSKAVNKESAEKLAAFMMSKDAQTVSQGGGFPVNKAAFEELFNNDSKSDEPMMSISTVSESGVDLSIDMKWPTEEQAKQFKSFVEGLTTPSNTDSMIREAVSGAAADCLNGITSVDEAVKAVMQKVNLYLSE